jgi:hypothetical protein
MQSLRPCPFCAGLRVYLEKTLRDGYAGARDDPDAYAFLIRCCSCAGAGPWAKSIGGAIHGWTGFPVSTTPPYAGPAVVVVPLFPEEMSNW